MNIAKYLSVLVMLCLEGGETGGGGKHHDHVKLHIPEFHHHDHHKKVITIHHHHHKPKKEHHHHHHHHHHKPHIPHGHHYSHNHKKVHLKTTTVTKGHGHGSHGHHHNHHGHHGHHGQHHGHHGHGHHGHGHHGHGHHHDAPYTPAYGYTPNDIPSYENDFTSGASYPSYDRGIPVTGFTSPQVPQVHGISHTVKQVKVFDSLPGALPNRGVSHGYEVTEEGEDGDEAFVPLNNIQNTYPGTFGYVRSAAPQPTNDHFGDIPIYSAVQQSQNPFSAAPEPTSVSDGTEDFTGSVQTQSDLFSSSAPTQSVGLPSVSPSGSDEFPATFQDAGFDSPGNSFTGSDVSGPSFIANEENIISNDTPVSFSREAGIQQTTKTGNVETLVY